MMMMMMTLMKLANSATKFRHGMDKFYQPNSGLRGSRSRDEATYTSRRTGNREWQRGHLFTRCMIESPSTVRLRHTWIVHLLGFVSIALSLSFQAVCCVDFFGGGVGMPKNQRLHSLPFSHFPTLASRNCDRFCHAAPCVQPALLFSTCFFAHVDVMQLPRACVHYTNSPGLRVVNPPLT